MKMRSGIAMAALVCAILFSFAGAGYAASWRGVVDANGCTWARVRIENLSTNDTSWMIANCRTAVSSSEDTATTDAAQDWDGTVAAGAATDVWIYGILAGDVNVSTANGTASGYNAFATPDIAGDSEWVITVAADGTVSAAVEPAAYGVPAQFGTFPNFNE